MSRVQGMFKKFIGKNDHNIVSARLLDDKSNVIGIFTKRKTNKGWQDSSHNSQWHTD